MEILTCDIVGDVLGWLDRSDLLKCNLISKRVFNLIIERGLWKNIFKQWCEKDNNWVMPPDGTVEPSDWMKYHSQYSRELANPVCIRKRSIISRKYRWRIGSLNTKLEGHKSKIKSENILFSYSEMINNTIVHRTLNWEIFIQKLPKENHRQFGIFISQQGQVRCYFSLATLSHDYSPKHRFDAEKTFHGDNPQHTACGWIFPIESLTTPDMTIIEFDVTIFPTELNCVNLFYDLIASETTEDRLKRFLVSALGEFATHHASNNNNAKKYIQVNNGGPLPLVRVFEDPATSQELKTAVAGCLWNILDTSTMYMEWCVLERIIYSACRSLIDVLFDQDEVIEAKESTANCTDEDLSDINFCHPDDQPSLSHDSSKTSLVNSLCGLMWNVPTTPENRSLLTRNKSFFVALAGVLSNKKYQRSHICCLHILTTLKVHGSLPQSYNDRFSAYLRAYLEKNESRREVPHSEVGVALSLRDVAEFFLPLVLSDNLDCISFGKWAVSVFYFKSVDIYNS